LCFSQHAISPIFPCPQRPEPDFPPLVSGVIFLARFILLARKYKTQQHVLIHVVETELCSLHIGNIARYRLLPCEFEAWQHF
jgi:hypothetical protein